MPKDPPNALGTVAVWIILCAFFNCLGWALSAAHQLNAKGYAISLVAAMAAVFALRRRIPHGIFPVWNWRKQRWRLNHSFPLAFSILAVLAILGGVIYAPTNYDALAYRTPRVLHWLAEGRWHWIHTEFNRLNARACGFEWLSAPLIALTKTDRLLFLLNAISFLLLPGLVFSLFRFLGVRARVAWHWMWVVPTGYCFLLQAGSIGNDLFATPFVLAALVFALRAQQTARIREFWLSLLAAGLFTGVKANTLPLLLVWLVILAPCWKLPLSKIICTAGIMGIALASSFFPTAILNFRHCGDWTGAAAERLQFKAENRWARLAGNAGIVVIHNLMPPIAPFAATWNDRIAPRLLPQKLHAAIGRNFLAGPKVFSISELEIEEGSGLGLGACGLLLATAVVAFRHKPNSVPCCRLTLSQNLFLATTAIAFGALAVTSFVASGARLLTSYYPLLVVPFLWVADQGLVIRKRWVRNLMVTASVLAGVLLLLNPARPLFPVETVLKTLGAMHTSPRLLERAEKVYSVYGQRARAFAPALALLPADTRVIGIVSFDDPEAALWQPFGSRRVVHVCPGDATAALRAKGVEYVWVNMQKFAMLFQLSFEQWLEQVNGRATESISLTLRAGEEASAWRLVKLL